MTDPTDDEIDMVSTRPSRFRRMYPTAIEVAEYASSRGGRLPAYVWRLSDRRWDDLSETLRELDELHWIRGIAA